MMILVPASYGGCDEWGWNPASETEVVDVGDRVKLRMGRPMLRLHPKLVEGWGDAELARRLKAVGSVGEARRRVGGAAWNGDRRVGARGCSGLARQPDRQAGR